MIRPESFSSHPEVPLVELTLEEMDIELNGDKWVLQMLRNVAQQQGYTPDRLLYRGIDRADMDAQGNFVHDRLEGTHAEGIWAFTDAEFALSAERTEAIGERFSDSPLFYALKGTDEPALVVLNADKLRHLEGYDTQYLPLAGHRLEDALIAVVNFRH